MLARFLLGHVSLQYSSTIPSSFARFGSPPVNSYFAPVREVLSHAGHLSHQPDMHMRVLQARVTSGLRSGKATTSLFRRVTKAGSGMNIAGLQPCKFFTITNTQSIWGKGMPWKELTKERIWQLPAQLMKQDMVRGYSSFNHFGASVSEVAMWGLIGANFAVFRLWQFWDRHFMIRNFMIAEMFGGTYVLNLYLAGAIAGSLGHLVYCTCLVPWLEGIPSSRFNVRLTPYALGAYLIGADLWQVLEEGSKTTHAGHLVGALMGAVAWLKVHKGLK